MGPPHGHDHASLTRLLGSAAKGGALSDSVEIQGEEVAANVRVLLVDDHDLFRTGLRNLLEERGVEYTTWEGWNRLDAHEAALGKAWTEAEADTGVVRERVKVVPREEMIRISRGAED